MLYPNESFVALNGAGYLTDGTIWKPRVAYKLVMRSDNFLGGGVLL